MKLTGSLALLLATACTLGSCSLFEGKKKRPSPSTYLPSNAPNLGGSAPDLGGVVDKPRP